MGELISSFIPIAIWFQSLGNWLVPPFQFITFLGNEAFYLLVMPALYWCYHPHWGMEMGLMLLLSGGVNSLLKLSFRSPRPFWVSTEIKGLASGTTFGFPSGHAQNAAGVWGWLAQKLKKTWLQLSLLLLITLIGFSRLVLGVHFLHDVVAGWLFGVFLLTLYLNLKGPFLKWFMPKGYRFQIAFIFLVSLLLIILGLFLTSPLFVMPLPESWVEKLDQPFSPYSLDQIVTVGGTLFGLVAGAVLLRQESNPPNLEGGSPEQKILRYFIGLLGLFILWGGLDVVFPEGNTPFSITLRYFRYTLIGFWITWMAPVLFQRLKLLQSS